MSQAPRRYAERIRGESLHCRAFGIHLDNFSNSEYNALEDNYWAQHPFRHFSNWEEFIWKIDGIFYKGEREDGGGSKLEVEYRKRGANMYSAHP